MRGIYSPGVRVMTSMWALSLGLPTYNALNETQVWDRQAFNVKTTLRGHTGSVLALEIAREKKWLFSSSGDSTVRVRPHPLYWSSPRLRPSSIDMVYEIPHAPLRHQPLPRHRRRRHLLPCIRPVFADHFLRLPEHIIAVVRLSRTLT